jgi:multidrug efflux pump subunit AcrA (membrane-fusion protein)
MQVAAQPQPPTLEPDAPQQTALAAILEFLVVALEQPEFRAAASAVATRIAVRLKCQRVSLGLRDGQRSKVLGVSHIAEIESAANLYRDIAAAMDEALDQRQAVLYPEPPDAVPAILHLHRQMAERTGAGLVCTLPLRNGDRTIGALTLEWESQQDASGEILELSEHASSILGPVLALKRAESQSIWRRLLHAAADGGRRLFGARYWRTRLLIVVLVGLIVTVNLIQVTHTINSPVQVEALQQRVVIAPIDGFIATSLARAGDAVREGAVLATLDARELELERVKWHNQLRQVQKEYRGALAVKDRTQIAVLRARADQAKAQVALLDAQIKRTVLHAPHDGIVVKGDLSQSIGAPISKGEVLFEVAPLDAYRLVLQVDERYVDEIAVDQRGDVVLAGRPDERLPVRVTRVTPISSSEDGRNYFRVETESDRQPDYLRPGMTGIARIETGPRSLAWVATRDLIDWLRLTLWSYGLWGG